MHNFSDQLIFKPFIFNIVDIFKGRDDILLFWNHVVCLISYFNTLNLFLDDHFNSSMEA